MCIMAGSPQHQPAVSGTSLSTSQLPAQVPTSHLLSSGPEPAPTLTGESKSKSFPYSLFKKGTVTGLHTHTQHRLGGLTQTVAEQDTVGSLRHVALRQDERTCG